MAKGIPKRRADELITRWKLEKLQQLVLEGDFDYRAIGLLQREERCPPKFRRIDRIPVDAVEIPDAMLKKHGLTSGNKQRAIAFGREIEAQGYAEGFRTIVDADLDRQRGRDWSSNTVYYTDFACLESYMWELEVLRRLLNHFCCDERIPDEASRVIIYDSISDVCRRLFAVRLVNDEHPEWSIEIHHSDASLSLNGLRVQIDLEQYLSQCKIKKEFREDVSNAVSNSYFSLLNTSPKDTLNGHDLVWALEFLVRKVTTAKQRLVGEEQIVQALIGYASMLFDFTDKRLFEKLEAWAR